jgi:hypothetical protein
MALKITAPLGTDRGITSEAYVRIADYQVSKYGSANFRVELFLNQADTVATDRPMWGGGQARNQQIGENVGVQMTKEVEATRTVQQRVQVVTEEVLDSEGEIVTPAGTTWEMQDVEETYMKTVPDLSALEDGTIFAFGYAKLKDKLVELFGAENVVDC